ncbi:hypothetical protein Tco_0197005, partial [Tanacetum coccineum]
WVVVVAMKVARGGDGSEGVDDDNDDDDNGVVGDEGVVVRGVGWWHIDGGKYGVGCRGCRSEDGDVAVVVMVAGAW